ncbi:twin-arginine translocation signal domain-containing protein [Nocardia salmonicida]|uniref:twin-arginine translocation signal domain-containing protein n=1 Tax=Nocardia salmonicida TaxID=53431 RepID=UPI0036A5DCE5
MTLADTVLSRRALLGAVAAVAATAGLAPTAHPEIPRGLPNPGVLADDVAAMVDLGLRYPGSPGHDALVDHMHEVYERHGLRVTRDSFTFDRWSPEAMSLGITSGTATGDVPVAGPYPNSGSTPPGGISGRLVYLPGVIVPELAHTTTAASLGRLQPLIDAAVQVALAAIGDVRGKIVVVDNPVPRLRLDVWDSITRYRHDPDGLWHGDDDYTRVWLTLLTASSLTAFRAAGAAGAVLILDASPANTAGQYTPFTRSYQDLPALIVDRDQGARLRAASCEHAVLELRATRERASSDSLVAVLPGRRSGGEALIVHTHTDGMNAFEENGAIAQLRLAEYFARADTDRDLVFSSVTGHFGPGLPETDGFIEHHPDVIARAVASVTIEHFGATEWVDTADGYGPTGQIEPTVAFHSDTGIRSVAVAATQQADLRRFALLSPIGPTFFGVGAKLHAAGVPGVAYIGGPNYLCAEGPRGHLDKFDAARMAAELGWTARLLELLDAAATGDLRTRL